MKRHLAAGDLSGGLPGSNISKDDLPDGPKPGQALKNLPSGSAGSQVSSQVCCCARLLAAVVVLGTLLVCNAVAVRMYGAVWLDWQIIAHESCRSMHYNAYATVQVGNAASKGGSVADKAGSAAKDIKGKNPFGE